MRMRNNERLNTSENKRQAKKRKSNMVSLAEEAKEAARLGMSYGEYQVYKREKENDNQ